MAESERLYERNQEIWRLYLRGRTQREIARQYGISQPAVQKIIGQVRDSIPQGTRDELVQREAAFLDEVRDQVKELFDMAPPPAFDKDGNALQDPESGAVVRDYQLRLNALGGLMKVMERHAKMLGLDAATKVDATVTTGEDEAATALAAEAQARLAEADTDN